MADPKTIYQAIDVRYDVSTTESNGPVECLDLNDSDWLGPGFYFWDSHIELAHQWGNSRYTTNNKRYYICKSICTLDNKCYDLHESGDKRIEFEKYSIQVSRKLRVKLKHILVRDVVLFLRSRPEWYNKYNSIRILGNSSFKYLMSGKNITLFNHNNSTAVYLKYPAVQFCFFENDVQSINGYTVVFTSPKIEQRWA